MNQKNLKILLDKIVSCNEDCLITDITLDSRRVKKGSLFLAVKGESADGRQFISQACRQGAAAVVYDPQGIDISSEFSVPIISVVNLKEKLGLIAARFYDQPTEKMNVIGITGTNGKTSCTHFIAQALNGYQKKCAVLGTVGYGFPPELIPITLTTPDVVSLQRYFSNLKEQGAEYLAMEVSSHALVQGRVDAVHFDIAVFTQLSRDHLDYHKTIEAYAQAKERLFQSPGLQYGVVNADDALGQKIAATYAKQLRMVTYSADPALAKPATIQVKKISKTNEGFVVAVQTPWGSGEFKTPLLGRFNISNLLAVFGVLGILEIPFSQMMTTMENLHPVVGRMHRVTHAKPMVIVDYSHTPDALSKALQSLREHLTGKLWCVFGCGGNRDRGKRPQMAAIAEQFSDYVIVTNDNPRTESPELIAAEITQGFSNAKKQRTILDREKAIEYAIETAQSDDIILIAGKGHESYQIIGHEMKPFNDIQVAEKYLSVKSKAKIP